MQGETPKSAASISDKLVDLTIKFSSRPFDGIELL